MEVRVGSAAAGPAEHAANSILAAARGARSRLEAVRLEVALLLRATGGGPPLVRARSGPPLSRIEAALLRRASSSRRRAGRAPPSSEAVTSYSQQQIGRAQIGDPPPSGDSKP